MRLLRFVLADALERLAMEVRAPQIDGACKEVTADTEREDTRCQPPTRRPSAAAARMETGEALRAWGSTSPVHASGQPVAAGMNDVHSDGQLGGASIVRHRPPKPGCLSERTTHQRIPVRWLANADL